MQAEVTGTEGDNILPAGINIDIIDKLIRFQLTSSYYVSQLPVEIEIQRYSSCFELT